LATAWVHAIVIDASFVVGTMVIFSTFSSLTSSERVSYVSWKTCADRSFPLGVVITWSTLGVQTAWIWLTQVLLFERSALDERITSHVFRTEADGSSSSEFTVGVDSARTFTRVGTLVVMTSRLAPGAICIRGTFSLA
jgi:hypothetical protein